MRTMSWATILYKYHGEGLGMGTESRPNFVKYIHLYYKGELENKEPQFWMRKSHYKTVKWKNRVMAIVKVKLELGISFCVPVSSL